MAEGPDPDTRPYDALNTETLSEELSTVSDWYQLGIKLGVPDYKLDEIQRSYPTEGCSRWRVEVLSLWLRMPNCSWKRVVRALQKMGENTLAERIQRKYIKRQSNLVAVSATPSYSASLPAAVHHSDSKQLQAERPTTPEQQFEREGYTQSFSSWISRPWSLIPDFFDQGDSKQLQTEEPTTPEQQQFKAEGSSPTEEGTPAAKRLKIETTTLDTPVETVELSSLHSVGVIGQTSVLYTGIEQNFVWRDFGLKLKLPSNALPPDISECQINIRALGHDQFKFPDDCELISAIYSISSPCTFQKPALVEIQHCADANTIEQCSQLSFVVARSTGLQEELLHSFSVENGGVFSPHSRYGCIQIAQFSLWSTVYNLLPGRSVQRIYSAALYYIHDGINSWKVHFVITWDLDVHIDALNNHFGKIADVHQQVEFDADGKISLDISEDGINRKGWTITPLSYPAVKKEQVDRYTHGRRIPSCQILVEWADNERAAVRSICRVALNGVKEPSFFQIECKPIDRTPLMDTMPSVLETEPRLHQLENEIASKIPTKWRAVGIQLGLQANKLDQISAEENDNCQCCFRRVFSEWQSQNCN